MVPYLILHNVAFDVHINLRKVVQGGLSRHDLYETREVIVSYCGRGEEVEVIAGNKTQLNYLIHYLNKIIRLMSLLIN